MVRSDTFLSETDIWPSRGKCVVVQANQGDDRRWFADSAVCAQLEHYRIRHLAYAALPAPFRIVRTRLSGSYFLACLSGAGKVLVNKRWITCRRGQAALLPPGALQAFYAMAGKPWEFCWVRYQELPGQRPLATTPLPVVAAFAGEPLRHAILGLNHEARARGEPRMQELWIQLIHNYVLGFSQPAEIDERLWRLWEEVEQNLSDDWPLARMEKITHLGEKQLQRLCHAQLGRSPRQHLIWLRMRRAAQLLEQTDSKIETVATRVGYQNPFVFSATFKRVLGCSPSAYPRRRGST